MVKNGFIFITLISVFFFNGCAILEHMDGSSKDEINKFRTPRKELWTKVKTLETKNNSLQIQNKVLKDIYMEEYKKRLAGKSFQKEEQIAYTQRSMTVREMLLSTQVIRLKDALRTTLKKNSILRNKVDSFGSNRRSDNSLSKSHGTVDSRQKLNIKVLSGDGSINSANRMTNRLKTMGYNISKIDKAPRSNFQYNTVFFSPSHKNNAANLASVYNGKMQIKPLDWQSQFDLIVVTGKNL